MLIERKEREKSNPDEIRVGAYQFRVDNSNISNNLDKIEEIFARKDIEDFDLLVLPELFSSGFYYKELEDILELNEIIYEKLKSYARMLNLDICGSMVEREGSNIFNTLYYWKNNGHAQKKYRKIHRFFGMGEKENFEQGRELRIWHSGRWKWGGAVCYDLRFPEMFARLARNGVDGYLIPAQWPRKRISHWQALLIARAIETQSVVIGCNTFSDEIGGITMIVDWKGKVLAEADDEDEKLVKATLNMESLKKWREDFPVLKDWQDPKIYGY